ncbi:MAG TPA: threonine synthase [Armatimonadota bacterium]|nr:threonine synthase [Armatimonadota bacterium]
MVVSESKMSSPARIGVIERYREYLPVTDRTPVITLLEGSTPLIRADRLAAKIAPNLMIYLKYEGLNPTGSFKDRGMTMAISKAVEEGSKAVMCASTGNTSASAAAYAAKAGISCMVLIPKGNIALGKLSQAMIHGAKVIQIEGNFDQALNLAREITDKYPITLVNSLNPYRIEGQKSGAFEICDVLGGPPDFHAIPVGNAGNITAYWKGYKEYFANHKIKRLPKMIGFQAAGSAPIVLGHPVEKPETIATAIRIGNPASWKQAVAARDESGGLIDAVTDEEILEAYKLLANTEGIFCEPASAASVAGVRKKAAQGYFKDPATVVCILTGHGLKDPDCAIRNATQPEVVEAKMDALLKVLGY